MRYFKRFKLQIRFIAAFLGFKQVTTIDFTTFIVNKTLLLRMYICIDIDIFLSIQNLHAARF